jgi:hypothetical protein
MSLWRSLNHSFLFGSPGLEKYMSRQAVRQEVALPPLSQIFDNFVAKVLCELSIEIVSLKTKADAADYLHGVTRSLMQEPYRLQDQELDCASRYSKKMKSVQGDAEAHMVHKRIRLKSMLFN